MWKYHQRSGQLHRDGKYIATGYAGGGPGKNIPEAQANHSVGPLPRGRYTIGAPEEGHGGYTLRLHPHPENQMFGRSGFLIHGDKISTPGTASQGCIILPRAIRMMIWESGDLELEVVE
jgi:hypothetical protein